MPLPRGFVGLIVADTRRAIAWEDGLRAAGLEVARVETSGSDADKGDWQIGVARRDELAGRAFVSEVLRGDRQLRERPLLSGAAGRALWAIAAVIALLALAAAITWLGS